MEEREYCQPRGSDLRSEVWDSSIGSGEVLQLLGDRYDRAASQSSTGRLGTRRK